MPLAEVTLVVGYAIGLTRGHPELRPSLRVPLRAVIAAGAAAAVVLVLDLPALVAGVVALALYSVGVLALGAVPPELLTLFRGRGEGRPWAPGSRRR